MKLARLPTEKPNPASSELDALDCRAILATIQREDARVPEVVRAQLAQIEKAVNAAVKSLSRGGRLIYVGAGTSGRIAALDAAECPPTFGVSPQSVRAVIAGGPRALLHAAEAAEDDAEQGRRDLARLRVGPRDTVIGLSASGRTPYTLAALRYAGARRAATVAVTCNPGAPLTRAAISIVAETGPEVVAGSTRMKAALAQKMVLHMISTATMVRLGYVFRGYMVGVRPTNEKLVARACSIIAGVTGVSRAQAARVLEQAGRDVRAAILMVEKKISRAAASQLLRKHCGNLRAALAAPLR